MPSKAGVARSSSGRRMRTVLPRPAAGGKIRDGDEEQQQACNGTGTGIGSGTGTGAG